MEYGCLLPPVYPDPIDLLIESYPRQPARASVPQQPQTTGHYDSSVIASKNLAEYSGHDNRKGIGRVGISRILMFDLGGIAWVVAGYV